MGSNNSEIIKQWIPEAHKVIGETGEDVADVPTAGTQKSAQPEKSASERKDEIIKAALEEAEMIKKRAYREGYSEGIGKAKVRFDEICRQNSGQLSGILREIEETKKRFDEELEARSLELSIYIAEKILNMKLENDDNTFVGLVKNTLAMMDKGEKFILKLNKREYEKLYASRCEAFLEELQCDVPVTVVKDVSLKAGGLILESEGSFIDAGIDTQLERIVNSLTHGDKQYHEAL